MTYYDTLHFTTFNLTILSLNVLSYTHYRILLGKFPGFGRGVSSHTLSGLKSLLGAYVVLLLYSIFLSSLWLLLWLLCSSGSLDVSTACTAYVPSYL